MNSVRHGNSSRLLAARCEELEQLLQSPNRQISEYTYIDERDSGIYSLKNGIRKSNGAVLHGREPYENARMTSTPRDRYNRSMEFEESSVETINDVGRGLNSYRNKRNRQPPVRQQARDEDTSSVYSIYGIPKQGLRNRQISSEKTDRLLKEQKRLERELKELSELSIRELSNSTENIHLNNSGISDSELSRHASQVGSRDEIDHEVAELLPPRPVSFIGKNLDGRSFNPMANIDEKYEELSVDFSLDSLRYPPSENQPIRILLSTTSPEYDSIYSKFKTAEDVMTYYVNLRSRERHLKEQIRLYRRTLEQQMDFNARGNVELKYFEAQRELNVMEKELVKLFTFLSPDMLQLLRNSESNTRNVFSGDDVMNHYPPGMMGSFGQNHIHQPHHGVGRNESIGLNASHGYFPTTKQTIPSNTMDYHMTNHMTHTTHDVTPFTSPDHELTSRGPRTAPYLDDAPRSTGIQEIHANQSISAMDRIYGE